MNSTKVFSLVGVTALIGVTLAGCASAGPSSQADCEPAYTFPTISEGKITVATFDGMPYSSQGPDGEKGFDVDFLNEFAAAACLDIEWQFMPSAAVIESVASGRADIAAGGWYATPERGEIVNLTDPIYVELPTIFSEDGADTVAQLSGQTVGTVTGYAWVDDLKAIVGSLKEYQSSDATLNDLAEGRIDYAVLGSIDAPYLVKTNKAFADIDVKIMEPDESVAASSTPMLPNFAHTKGNDELTAALNEKIAADHASGHYADLIEKNGGDPSIADVSKYE